MGSHTDLIQVFRTLGSKLLPFGALRLSEANEHSRNQMILTHAVQITEVGITDAETAIP